MNAHALIMAGGEGTRFYPLSTPEKPKQFLNLYGNASLLQHTFRRIRPIFGTSNILIATNQRFLPLVREHLPELRADQLIGEPLKKNTAPCIALAAQIIASMDPEAVMAVFPADHFVGDVENFQKIMRVAIRGAFEQRKLITLGVRPNWPSTEYGYIHCGDFLGGGIFRKVHRFVEKPNATLAQNYCNEGNYLWNGGIFVWTVETILKEVSAHLPKMYHRLQTLSIQQGVVEPEGLHRFFSEVEAISIDYGLLERSGNVLVLPIHFQWSDLGSLEALKRLADQGEIVLNKELLSQIPYEYKPSRSS